jgi:hypothetical protein
MSAEAPYPPDRHAKIHSLFCYWHSLRPLSGLPARKNFEPTDIPDLLADIWLIDVIPPTPRLRYRLVGTAIVEARGYNQTGTFLDEEVADFPRSQTYADIQKVLAGGVSWRRGVPDKSHRLNDIHSLERIFLPLASDGTSVDIILALTVFQPVNRARGFRR